MPRFRCLTSRPKTSCKAQHLLAGSPKHAEKARTFDKHSLYSLAISLGGGGDGYPRLCSCCRTTEHRRCELEKIGVALVCAISYIILLLLERRPYFTFSHVLS